MSTTWRERCLDRFRDWWRCPGPRRDLPLLALITAVVYLLTANHGPLGSATRYYEAARETLELNQWIVPHLGYVPYLEKPPLVYWMGAVAQWFGSHPLIASLPAGLATLVAVWATYGIGRAWRGPGIGLAAALLLLSCTFVQIMAGVLTSDPLLAGWLAVAWWCWVEWEKGERTQRRWLWGFYLAIAVGWMTKGPVALAIPAAAVAVAALMSGGLIQVGRTLLMLRPWLGAGIILLAIAVGWLTKGPVAWAIPAAAVAAAALVSGGLTQVGRTLLALRPWLGAGIILALNLPWTIAVWLHDPRLIEFFYLRINLDAFSEGNYNHAHSPWYYLTVWPAMVAPYTLVALPVLMVALWRAVSSSGSGPVLATRPRFIDRVLGRTALNPDPIGNAMAMVVVGSTMFLSLSSAKLETYLLPLLPAAVVLIVVELHEHRGWQRWWRPVLIVQGVMLFVLAVAVAIVLGGMAPGVASRGEALILAGKTLIRVDDMQAVDWRYVPALFAACSVIMLTASVLIIMAWRRRLVATFASLGIGLTLSVACIIPFVDELVPGRDGTGLITALRQRGGDDLRLPPEQRQTVIIEQEMVHDYELLMALRRRPLVLNHARELGIGFFVTATPITTPLPGPRQKTIHPYNVSGDNLAHPWLLNQAQFQAAWNGPERIWLICEDGLIPQLKRAGLTIHPIANARHNVLLSNRADP